MCFKDLKGWIFEVLKCWWCFTASNGSDLISTGCILPISQSSGTFRMSSVLIHQHTLFCPSVVSLLPDSISPLLFSHVTFSWEELNPVLPWAQLVLMCKCSLNPVLTRTTVLQGQSVRALLSVICRCFLLLWQSTDINNLGYHNSKHQMTNKPCLTCGTMGSAHAHNTKQLFCS